MERKDINSVDFTKIDLNKIVEGFVEKVFDLYNKDIPIVSFIIKTFKEIKGIIFDIELNLKKSDD